MHAALINGRYRSSAALGAGATSSVWLVHDELTRQPVALKLFAEELRESAAREFKTLCSLSHPGIAAAHECGLEWESGRFFFTSEAISGDDFVTAARRLDEPHQLLLLAHALRVLQFIHGRGLVHRDLKPENLLVMRDVDARSLEQQNPVRLIDFGLARRAGDCAEQAGSLPYMAPELFGGVPASPQSDLYGLGVVWYEVLSGERLITGSTQLEMIRAHRDVPRRLSDLPAAHQRLLASLLAADPRARPRTARDVLLELNRISRVEIPPETLETTLARVRSAFATRLPDEIEGHLRESAGDVEMVGFYRSGDDVLQLVAQSEAAACVAGRVPIAAIPGATEGVLAPLARQLQAILGLDPAATGAHGAVAVAALIGQAALRHRLALVLAPTRPSDVAEVEQLSSQLRGRPELKVVLLLEQGVEIDLVPSRHAVHADLLQGTQIARRLEEALGVSATEDLLVRLGSKPYGTGQARGALCALLSSGALELHDGRLVFFPERASTLDPPVGELTRVSALMQSLPPAARDLLAALAVAGRPSRAPAENGSAPSSVRELVASGLVEVLSRDTGLMDIGSPSVRECVLLCLRPEEARRAHAVVAAELEHQSVTDAHARAERGMHLAEAGEVELAMPELASAARALIAGFEIEQARRPIESLLAVSAGDPHWQYEARWLEGERRLRAGEPAAAVEFLQRALELKPQAESSSAIQATLAKCYEKLGDYARALQILDQASGDSDLAAEARAKLMIDRAFILYRQGRFDGARELCLSAGQMLKGPDLQRIRYGNLLGLMAREQGMLADAEAHLQAAVADARAIATPAFEAQALNSMAGVEFAQGKVRGAIDVLADAARVLHEHGERRQLHTLVHSNMAAYALVLGDLELAKEKLQLMRSFLEEQPDESSWATYELLLARVAFLEGDQQQADALLMSCAARQERIGERSGLQETLAFAVKLSARTGDLARAQALFERARATSSDTLPPNSRVFFLSAALELALQTGGDDDERLAQELNAILLRADPVLTYIESDVLVRFHLARERRQVAAALAQKLAERCAALGLDYLEADYRALMALCSAEASAESEALFEAALEKLGDRPAGRRVLAPLLTEYARRLLSAFHDASLDARERVQKLDRARKLAERAADVYRLIGDSLGGGQSQALLAEIAALQTDSLGRGDVARRMRNLERLKEVTKVISQETDDERLLRLIMDRAVELAEGVRGFLILLKGNSLEIRVARNLDDQDIHHPEFAVSHSVAMRVARTGEPLLISNAYEDLRFRESSSISRLHLLSIICVPLRAQDRVIGSLYVDHPSAVDRFDNLHLEVLSDLSDYAAIAIGQARLLSENQDRARALSASKREIERLNRELKKTVAEQARELVEVKHTLEKYRLDAGLKFDYSSIITQSPRMHDLLKLLDRVTESSNPVLITGESGTGKEVVARAIQMNGPRAQKRFVSLNCAAVPEPLIESELFGYVRGAFTGADRDKAGVFELADGGTLFLDEIGDMSLEVQKRLLRVLQSGEFLRLGAKEIRKVDVRIIGATNRNLKEMVKSALFREDLYYRLAVHLIDLPPLRERREDIPLLVAHFVEKYSAGEPGARKRVTAEAMEALQRHRWGGNVRELENEVRRLLAMTAGKPAIELDDLPEAVRTGGDADPTSAAQNTLKEMVDRFERDQVVRALTACGGNRTAAARMLGMSTRNLFKKIVKFGLE